MSKQTEYEKTHNLVSRDELKLNILKMFDELDDIDFHSIYQLVWSLTAKQLLMK